MPARPEVASSELPEWLQPSVLKLPVAEAKSQLSILTAAGERLAAWLQRAGNSEEVRTQIKEWRRHCGTWLDNNLSGQAAHEFNVAHSIEYNRETPTQYTGRQARNSLQTNLVAEVTALTSIANRLDQWVADIPSSATEGDDVTEQFIIGPPGQTSPAENPEGASFATDRKAVMVIYGHDREANTALFDWLRSIGLHPKEWNQLIHASGSASPYIGDVLLQAFNDAQVVVAFFTPDERVLARTASPAEPGMWRLQARPNVLIEAGMALITHPRRTVLIVLGDQELPSDLSGRHYIRLNPASAETLNALANRLRDAGCDIDQTGDQWLSPARFPDRASASQRLPGESSLKPEYELHAGQKLLVGHSLISPNGRFRLDMQWDGNLVLYRIEPRQSLWDTERARSGAKYLLMQEDGNLVLCTGDDIPVWDSGTVGQGGQRLVIQDDGNLVVYSGENKPVWDPYQERSAK